MIDPLAVTPTVVAEHVGAHWDARTHHGGSSATAAVFLHHYGDQYAAMLERDLYREVDEATRDRMVVARRLTWRAPDGDELDRAGVLAAARRYVETGDDGTFVLMIQSLTLPPIGAR